MKLTDKINDLCEVAKVDIEMNKENLKGKALAFFSKNVLPNGDKWPSGVELYVRYDNAIKVTREQKKEKDGIITYTARLRLGPGKGGGSGIGVEGHALSMLISQMGSDSKSVDAICKAFEMVAKQKSRHLNEAFRKWLSNPENFWFKISGWGNKDNYIIKDVMFSDVRYEKAVMDMNRRAWPSGVVQIWIPIVADVVMTVKRK